MVIVSDHPLQRPFLRTHLQCSSCKILHCGPALESKGRKSLNNTSVRANHLINTRTRTPTFIHLL